ncbi:aminotransferase class III-fold pyridoxal phosphate-dependent enzyme [Limisalsivibrio acetivorans]|uniref:aminotransferase class III-fold pyridoxal phosphate-dependent enzyme n=1 Tax=Limisalsivibrio acetivorans TaxID=1304888 RepID=UPI0003B51D5D|nr:aminotransferase class III-fold pyridoxal phosphate-dependent enzyme [Limisalsivibrio acetivorans]
MEHVFFCTGHELKIKNAVKAEGLYITDDQERKYLDLESGVWCTSIGHGNPYVNDAVKEQIDKLIHAGFCYSSEIMEYAAKELLRVAGMEDGKCVFLCSGSEGVEVTRQMSRTLTGRGLSMTLHDSYLGSYSSLSEESGGWFLLDWERCKNCPVQQTCDETCHLFAEVPEDISEFIFEPGSSSGLVNFPPEKMIENLADKVRALGGKVIVNEVTTGVGRTGKWFGFQHYRMEPDFIAVGKGIGNGYPVSAALLKGEDAEKLLDKGFHYSQSHQNDPLGASVVFSVIRFIENSDLVTHATVCGDYLYKELEGLVDGKLVTEHRGRGLMHVLEFADPAMVQRVYSELIEKGYIVGNRGRALRIDPPLIIEQNELEVFLDVFRDVLMGLSDTKPA